ncbi:diol dehydratase reactivase subunit alpha [Actinomycetospora sp. CA-101289]|uniref:diol dehydratase reactivase subunit alpha n=1 Tax=Actinomycetospora sp. CA-101289 TaxID=3239893 RepID=UPI003D9687CC
MASGGPRLVVGVDIGNSTTEACCARVDDDGGVEYLGSGLAPTTGIKGTPDNAEGVRKAAGQALADGGCRWPDVDLVLTNEATPVISGLAMETITETVVTESTMIGHDPRTPGGSGIGVGTTVALADLADRPAGEDVLVVVPAAEDFEDVAEALVAAAQRGVGVRGAILGGDDAVLVANRLEETLPIVDEVTLVDEVPLGMLAAVEVAEPGRTIRTLSNSYGIATLFELDAEQTKMISPVARSLTGNRSAVVVRTPGGDVTDRRVPAGSIALRGRSSTVSVEVDAGADEIMRALARIRPLVDAEGESGTHVGGMIAGVRDAMSELTGQRPDEVAIEDLLAVDTLVPQEVRGGLAKEVAREDAVLLAAMVRTSRGPMEQVAAEVRRVLAEEAQRVLEVEIGGIEAEMAVGGALTTPGSGEPIVVLDLGGGSTDAAHADTDGEVYSVHVAGAGDLVTTLIDAELGLDDKQVAEEVKRYPLAKVESFFHIRHENGTAQFFTEPLAPELFARVVVLTDEGMHAVPGRHDLATLRHTRREAKRRVFVVNALRALEQIAPGGTLRQIEFVVLLGGSALDFEIPDMIADAVAPYGIVCGTGNVRGSLGPRNAVASGLVAGHARGRRVSGAA